MTIKVAKISKNGTVSAVPKYDGTNYETDWISSVSVEEQEGADHHKFLTYIITFKDGFPGISQCFAQTDKVDESTDERRLAYIFDDNNRVAIRFGKDIQKITGGSSGVGAGGFTYSVDFVLVCSLDS